MAYLFRGGIYFKGVERTRGLTSRKDSGELFLYLSHGQTPEVSLGDAVCVGQRAASEGKNTPPLHFPVSGIVTAIASDHIGTFIAVSGDGENAVSSAVRKMDKKLSECVAEEIIEKIRSAGIAEPDGTPAADKLACAVGKVGICVISCAESEPYIACDAEAALLSPVKVVNGMKIFLRALGIRRGVVAVPENNAELYKKLSSLTEKSALVTITKVSGKYPQGDERRLSYAVTGSEPERGEGPVSLGCVIFNVQTCLAVYDAFVTGMPQVRRVVTVAGDAVASPVNVDVPIGTRFSDLIGYAGGMTCEPGLILNGGPLRGVRTMLDGAVCKTTKALLLFKNTEKAADRAVCIRCGRCVSACPERLMPNYIYNALRNGRDDRAASLGADVCVGCGLCSYVCPGKAPVTELIAEYKNRRRNAVGEDNSTSEEGTR